MLLSPSLSPSTCRLETVLNTSMPCMPCIFIGFHLAMYWVCQTTEHTPGRRLSGTRDKRIISSHRARRVCLSIFYITFSSYSLLRHASSDRIPYSFRTTNQGPHTQIYSRSRTSSRIVRTGQFCFCLWNVFFMTRLSITLHAPRWHNMPTLLSVDHHFSPSGFHVWK